MANNHPPFPNEFNGYNIVWGQGNDLVSPRLLASIPMYTLVDKEKEPERYSNLYKSYWDEQKRIYDEAKSIYEDCVYVDTTWCGNTDASARITKIVITADKQYICWKASREYQAKLDAMPPLSNGARLHLKPGRYSLNSFISLIKNKQIRIIKSAKNGK